MFEFLLINHPLDCPVCDKGGECPLQDFSYTFGPDQSRMEFPRRVFDGEGVKADVDFGPTLMLNRNRCILCTRCVRFMRDVDGDAQINIIDRGYGSEIATFQEEGVHSLLSGNLMDVCPVGAITTRDYRFKSRPWDNPHAVDTICTLCSKGCNTTAWIKAKPEWAKGSRLIRFTPRLQPRRQRLLDVRHRPLRLPLDRRRRPPAHSRSCATAHGASSRSPGTTRSPKLRERLAGRRARPNPDGVRFLLSAHASHEELFLFRRLTEELARQRPDRRSASAGGIDEKPQPARHEVQGAGGRRAERQRRAHARPGAGNVGDAVGAGRSLGAAPGGRGRTRVGAVRVRPGPGRLARRHRLDCRRAQPAASCRCSSSRACC